jgi:hypothetical protein
MAITYTNRKSQTYTLYKGKTKTGKPRYYFGREGQGEPVMELPPGFTISESVNGVVSLVKDRPSLIQVEEIAVVEAAVKQHPNARHYRVSAKHDRIEVYEQIGFDYDALESLLPKFGLLNPEVVQQLQATEEQHAQFSPVLRFILFDVPHRQFKAQRMCYRGSIDGWLELMQMGSITELAQTLIPTLSTDQFYELW